jgi:hypothetical protein
MKFLDLKDKLTYFPEADTDMKILCQISIKGGWTIDKFKIILTVP